MPFDAGAVYGRLLFDISDFDRKAAQLRTQSQTVTRQGINPADFASQAWARSIIGLTGGFLKLGGTIAIVTIGIRQFTALVTKGVGSLDRMNATALRLAGTLKTVRPDISFGEALERARALVGVADRLDAIFSGTGAELVSLVDIASRFGIEIDLTTERAQQQFVAFAELIKMFNVNLPLEIAAFSEIRSLVSGVAVRGAEVARALQLQGVNLKEQVPLWIEQGRLINEIIERFPGLTEQVARQSGLLSTLRSSWQSIVERVLRAAFVPALEDLIRLQAALNGAVFENGQLTGRAQVFVESLRDLWAGVSGTVQGIAPILGGVVDLTLIMLRGVSAIAKGIGLVAILIRDMAQNKSWREIEDNLNRIAFANEQAFDPAQARGVRKATKDLRDEFFATAEGAEFLFKTGQIGADELIKRLTKFRDETATTTEEGLERWAQLTLKIADLEDDRTKKAEQGAKKRADEEEKVRRAVADVQADILELEGRTFEARLARIREEGREIAKATGNEVLARRAAALKELDLRREMQQDAQKIVLEGIDDILEVTQAGGLRELLQATQAEQERLQAIRDGARARLITEQQAAAMITQTERTASLQRLQIFQQTMAAMQERLKTLQVEFSRTQSNIVDIDIQINRKRGEIAGKSQADILESEQNRLRQATRGESLSTQDRIRFNQQLQQTIEQRIDLMKDEPLNYFKVQDLQQQLNRARRDEVDLLKAARAEAEVTAQKQIDAIGKAKTEIVAFQGQFMTVLQALQTGAGDTMNRLIQALGQIAPQQIVKAWTDAVAAIKAQLGTLPPGTGIGQLPGGSPVAAPGPSIGAQVNVNGVTIQVNTPARRDLFQQMLDWLLTDPQARQQVEAALARGRL